MDRNKHAAYWGKFVFTFVITILGLNTQITAQDVDLTITSNYSSLPQLESESIRNSNKLFLSLTLNDFSYRRYDVRLRLSIASNGVTISTSSLTNFKRYTLIPGIPQVITSSDLADYFDVASLDFNGIDKNRFLEDGILPEGNYKLCFTAIDAQADGVNPLSNTDCDALSLKYTPAPIILSSISEAITTNKISWKSDVSYEDELEYEVQVYEFLGGDVNQATIYQMPLQRLKASSELVDVRSLVKSLNSDKLYTFFIHAKSKFGFNHFVKNNGFSKGLLFERQMRAGDCVEDPVLEHEIITGPNGLKYIHFTMVGCDTYIPPQYSSFVPNVYPYDANTGYDFQIYCANDDCRYDFEYGDQNCVVDHECETDNGCYGKIDYGCECDPWCVQINIIEGMVEGVRSLIPDLPTGCDNPQYQWSDGSTTSTIPFPNDQATFSLVITCASGCTFCGIINSRGNCRVGSWCNDGNPCTINDEWDANCDCIGTPIDHCEEDDPVNTGGCAGDLSITLSQIGEFYFLSASIDCNPVEYMWNNDETLTSASLVLFELDGQYTLDILCDDGCSYTASLDLSCTEGAPCDDDNDPTTIEIYNQICECITFPCPDADNDGLPDDCDQNQACYGNISIIQNTQDQLLTVDVSELECPDEVTYLWATGATTASIPFSNPNATYSVTVTCSTGCQYIATSIGGGTGGEDDCVIGEPCVGTSCLGQAYLNENCDCIDIDPDYTFTTTYQIISYDQTQGQVTVKMSIDDEVCQGPTSFNWNTGQTGSSIVITNLEAVYVVTVTCADCEFTAFYSLNAQDCVVGAPCIDGNNCTQNDTYNDDCECVGIPLLDGDDNPMTDCNEDTCITGYPCDDGDPCTYFDIAYGDVCCLGFDLIDAEGNVVDDCGDDPCIIGAACNDGDPCTIGDIFTSNCDCIGESTPDCDDNCTEEAIINISATENYNEVLLTAGITSCESDISYEWSNGSSVQNIIVNSQTGTYSVIITCGDCTYTAYYNTNGCLVGLPCNDGLDCTENDEVQENCECHGTNIDEVEFAFSEEVVYKNTCDYNACLPSFDVYSKFVISSVDVILEDGTPLQLNKGMNSQGFDFPYCYSSLSVSCDGLPSPYVMASDISAWLGDESTVFVKNIINELTSCYGTKEFFVENSTVQFVAINGYNDFNENLSFPFSNGSCEDGATPIGVNVTATVSCETTDEDGNIILPVYVWSDGTQSQTAYIPYSFSTILAYCLEVTATCMNGCTYTDTYGVNCEQCIYGSPCDDGNICTINDAYNAKCLCVGEPLSDSDNDGVCDLEDECPGYDDNIDLDGDGIPDFCDPEVECDNTIDVSLTTETISDPLTYCTFLNDPIFKTTIAESVQLDAFVFKTGSGPIIIDASLNNTGLVNFPYEINKYASTLIDDDFFDDMSVVLGSIITFGVSEDGTDDVSACIPMIKTIDADGNITYTPDPIPGVLIHATSVSPFIPLSLQFSWGEDNNVFTKSFSYFGDENYQFPVTLSASIEDDCGIEGPSYLWSTGETTSSINIASSVGMYSVTVTCGVCTGVGIYNPQGCEVGSACSFTDECDVVYPGSIDPYCDCIILDDIILEDSDGDGIPDCIDDCDEEFTQTTADGDKICCDNPPSLIYDEEEATKTVYNHCIVLPESTIDGLEFQLSNGVIIELNENSNYDQGFGESEGNFFHFPYCTENNCDYFGPDISIPYRLENIKSLAYDLAKWAAFNGYEMKPSTYKNNNNCTGCDSQEGEYNFYIDEVYLIDEDVDPILEDPTIKIDKALVFFTKEGSAEELSFNSCKQEIDAGYYVRFDENWGGCGVTGLVININNGGKINVLGIQGQILNISNYKFGPVPHKGVGFRATITCITGCVYEIETPDADCIVGDPCDLPYPCAETSVMGYDNVDCRCLTVGNNDNDHDGVCNDDDQCEGYDDNLDADSDGIPDGCDTECGFILRTYYLDISSDFCTDSEGGCALISKINVLLSDGTQAALSDDPLVDESYYLGPDLLCVGDQSEELENDIMGWFINNGFIVGSITVDNYTLTISGTNVRFLYALNECEDEVSFHKIYTCNKSYAPNNSQFNCANNNVDITRMRLMLSDGTILELDKTSPEFNFPYDSNYPDDSNVDLDKAWDPNFINDLTQNYEDVIIVSVTDINGMIEFVSNAKITRIAGKCGGSTKIILGGCNSNCDDGWDCTINDQLDENCNCIGTFLDSDNDGVCDAEDQCHGFPDHFDSDGNGTPDGCDTEISIPCYEEIEGGEVVTTLIPFCEYLGNVLTEENIGKVQMNNLIEIQKMLADKFKNLDNPLNYLPYPILEAQIESNQDCDQDGIVDILDPCPCKAAIQPSDGVNPHLFGTHGSNTACILSNCDKDNCEDNIPKCEIEIDDKYLKERAMLLNTFLFTVIEGIYHYNYQLLSFIVSITITSDCAFDIAFKQANNLSLDMNDLDHNGHIFDSNSGCYVYFDIDCEGNCLINYATDFDGNSNCDDVEVIGEPCTTDPNLENAEGYFYLPCPPIPEEGEDEYDICDLFEVVANPAYDISNPGNVDPCICQLQMLANGDPATAQDSDGDGVCNILDQCAPAVDANGNLITESWMPGYIPFDDLEDSDEDGIPDCMDGCDGDLSSFIKEGYAAPTGSGDVCDDGNPCTYDDVITEACKCQGVYIDSDDDGVYDCEECEFVETAEGSDMYECVGCQGTVDVDAIGNEVEDPDAPDANEVANTWIGCDVCPGIPDGDPEDQDDFPMDYNNNGLPDCIDPPYYPIPCPIKYLVIPGVGISLVFDVDNIDVDKLPNPIRLLAKNEFSDQLVDVPYLTVGFVREVIGTKIVDDEEIEVLQTEIMFEFDHNYAPEQLTNIQIMFSEHQVCTLDGIDDASPVPCPTEINIFNDVIQVYFEIEADDNIDLSEFVGEVIIDPDGKDPATFEFVVNQSESSSNSMALYIYGEIPNGWTPTFDFSGSITLPNGQVCNYSGGDIELCFASDGNGGTMEVVPGSACDDDNPCTHHDKYVSSPDGTTCICEGVDKPDTDGDSFCDEIDPCPEDWNAMPETMDVADIDDCPCPMLELSTLETEIDGLQNSNDFYAYFGSDLSGYSNITIEVDNGQDDAFDPTNGNGVEAVSPIVIANLTGGHNYTITITVYCDFGTPQVVTYEVDVPFGDSPIICGVELEPFDLSTQLLLSELNPGEAFKASDFDVKVKSASGSYGKFTGKGYIKIPFFGNPRLNVTFNNITISNTRQLIQGYVVVNGFGLAVLGDDLSDQINNTVNDIINVLDDINDILDELIPLFETIEEFIETTKDLVSEEAKECIVKAKEDLEALKLQAEQNPSDATLVQKIKDKAKELQDCIDDYNAELEIVAGKFLSFLNDVSGYIQMDCDTEGYGALLADLMNNENPLEEYQTALNEIIDGLNGGGPTGTHIIEKSISYQEELDDISNPIVQKANVYYGLESNRDLCLVFEDLKSKLVDPLITDSDKIKLVTEVLRATNEVGKALTDIIKEDLLNNVANQTIYENHKVAVDNAFKSVIAYRLYNINQD